VLANLILVFCLTASPSLCQEERPLLEPMPAMACMAQGQQYAQEWLADHPKWTLASWRCEDPARPKRMPS
jgi:hypothetical protein